MSSSYVRETFRTWAQETSALVGVQFYDTINVEQSPQDLTWWTAEFIAEFMDGTFCRPDYRETGFIRVIVNAQPGTGDLAAVQAMEGVVPLLMQKIDNTQRLVLERYEPIQEAFAGNADATYRVTVAIDYSHSL